MKTKIRNILIVGVAVFIAVLILIVAFSKMHVGGKFYKSRILVFYATDCRNSGCTASKHILWEANPFRFEALSEDNPSDMWIGSDFERMGKDDRNVYYIEIVETGDSWVRLEPTIIKEVDVQTFQHAAGSFFKDSQNLYFQNTLLEGAHDLENFRSIDKYYYTDGLTVWYDDNALQKKVSVLNGADPKTFLSQGYGYSEDANNSYYLGKKIEE